MIGGTLEKIVRHADGTLTNECLSFVRFKDLEVSCSLKMIRRSTITCQNITKQIATPMQQKSMHEVLAQSTRLIM